MNGTAINSMLTLLAALTAAAFLSLVACYLWGRLIGRTARRVRASKWRAYSAALFPFLLLMGSLMCDDSTAVHSLQAFLGLGTPALLGTFRRWHQGPEATMAQMW